MKKHNGWVLLLCLLLSCAPCLAWAAEALEEPAYRVDTLRLEGGTDWGVPSPFLHASRGPGEAKMKLVFASLLEKDEAGDIGWLAESWSQTGTAYRFTLHEGLTFHDGRPLTAEDVAFTVEYYRQFPPVAASLGAGEGFLVTSVTVEDPLTVTFHVEEALADTLTSLGSFVVLPKHIWQGVSDPYTFTGEGYLVGSGAYRSTGYDPATGAYEFTAFSDFVPGRAAAGRVLFVPVSDGLLAFESGEIDITEVPPDLLDRYREDSRYALLEKANDTGYKLLIQFENLPDFLDRSLREALYHALNREAIVERVLRGAGSVGSAGYVPAGSLYYNEDCAVYPYQPEAARAVFEDRGYALTLLAAESGNDVGIAELIQLDLEAAGIAVTVEAFDSATRDSRVNAGAYELALVGNGGWGNNPPAYLRTVFSDLSKNSGGNPHTMGPIGYQNEEITALSEAQRYETDFDTRLGMFKDLQQRISEEIPLLVIANASTYVVYRPDHYDGWMKTYAYQQAEQNRLSYMAR